MTVKFVVFASGRYFFKNLKKEPTSYIKNEKKKREEKCKKIAIKKFFSEKEKPKIKQR